MAHILENTIVPYSLWPNCNYETKGKTKTKCSFSELSQ